MRLMLTLLIVLSGLFFSCDSGSEKKPYDKRFIGVAKASKNKAVTNEQIKTLVKVFHQSKNEQERQQLVRMTVYAMQSRGLGVPLQNFRYKVEQKSGGKKYFTFLNKQFPNICSLCKTKGFLPCKKCRGDGGCPNAKCKGGKISFLSIVTRDLGGNKKKDSTSKDKKSPMVTKACPQCKGTQKCDRCNGRGASSSRCPKCRSMGRFKVVEKSKKLYQKEVKSILSIF
ncbi:MAG: hypothetical protein HRT88_11930 [Lentisphaeraceae bacterium]|nr:hypothetical protein [Lentisphaeraceae bacterium]